jgi:hypothetical protein
VVIRHGRAFPPKPTGMWWQTYKRLQDHDLEAEMRADDRAGFYLMGTLCHCCFVLAAVTLTLDLCILWPFLPIM